MGLWKIDNVSSEEWHRRQLRRHDIRQWAILLLQLCGMALAVYIVIWLIGWLGI